VRDVCLRGRIRNEHPSSARVLVARYDGRRSECGKRRLLTEQAKKHSGSSGQLDGVQLPLGRPGRASRKRLQVTAATGRCMEPTRRCLVNDRERQKSVRPPGKAPPVATKNAARGVGIAAVQFNDVRFTATSCTANEVHRNESAQASARESSALSSLLTARTGGGGLTEANHTCEKMPGSAANAARGIA
jgi:hypothetical protein